MSDQNEFDILDPEVAKQLILDIESDQVKERRRFEYKQWLCYSGRLKEFVQILLKEALPKDSKWIVPSDVALSNKITNKKAKSYKDAPTRFILGNESASEELNELYEKGRFNESYFMHDVFTILHKYNFLRVIKREEEPLELEAMPSFTTMPVYDQNSGKLKVMVLNYPGEDVTRFDQLRRQDAVKLPGSNSTFRMSPGQGDGISQIVAESQDDSNPDGDTYAMWTDEQHATWLVKERSVDAHGKKDLKLEFVPTDDRVEKVGVNDYGVIPFAGTRLEPGIELPTPNPLTEQTITYNFYFSGLLGAAFRNIGTAVLKYPKGEDPDKLTSGLSVYTMLPQSKDPDAPATDLEYKNPASDLAGMGQVFLSFLNQVLSEHGISGAEGISGQNVQEFSSGLERAIASADLTDFMSKMQQKYIQTENDVFEIVQKVLEAHEGRNPFSEQDELTVIYTKPKVLISDNEVLANIEKRLTLGLMTEVEALMELDPNLTEESANEKLEKIREEKGEKAKRAQEMLGAPVEGNQPPNNRFQAPASGNGGGNGPVPNDEPGRN